MSLLHDSAKRVGPHLEWKVRLLAAGAALGVAGIYVDRAWLRWIGIALLAAGVLLRFAPGSRHAGGPGSGDGPQGRGPDT